MVEETIRDQIDFDKQKYLFLQKKSASELLLNLDFVLGADLLRGHPGDEETEEGHGIGEVQLRTMQNFQH